MKKLVGIVGCAGIPARYGGFETLAENLVKELGNEFEFIVYCSSFDYKIKRKEYGKARLKYIPINANGRSSILYDVVSILDAIIKVDLVLVLGVGGAFLFPLIRLFSKRKIVVNIDGLEWRRQKWGSFAKKYLKIQERVAVKWAHQVIADNEGIQEYLFAEYNRRGDYAPYGGDHTAYVSLTEATRAEFNIHGSDYFFSVCRIEPENNIHVILQAFFLSPQFKLIIVGNWKASGYGLELRRTYQNSTNIFLVDPIYELTKLDELRSNCRAYVHGHSAGGTNPSLVEAMNLGLAIICWDVNYNRYTTENMALFFKDVAQLQNILKDIEVGRFGLKEIANNMAKIAKEKYLWSAVAKNYFTILSK
jgi:glycosyltransferase involved in cell wall biosynthesis